MGIIHKFKQEVRDFIIEQKKTNPNLGCRNLVDLIEEKFQVKVSKSSVNSIIKNAGLSSPIGRRLKKKRRKFKLPPVLLPQEPPAPQLTIQIPTEEPPETPKEEPAITPPVEIQPEAPVEEKPPEKPIEAPAEALPTEKAAEPPPLEAMPEMPAPPVSEPAIAPSEIESSGAILLKAADCLLGGSNQIVRIIKSHLSLKEDGLKPKIDSCIYVQIKELEKGEYGSQALVPFIGKHLSAQDLSTYHNDIQGFRDLSPDFVSSISSALQEVSGIKISIPTGESFYLDGQFSTVWSSQHIPYDFSATLDTARSYINKSFYEDAPLILFTAPGTDSPTPEFFNLLTSLNSQVEKNIKITLLNNKLQEIQTDHCHLSGRRQFVFALWPWQYINYRRVKKIGEFKPFYFEETKKNLFIADSEIELSQDTAGQELTLRGCAIKTSLNEKIRVLILGNLAPETSSIEELANLYLRRWPNLDEGFQYFSRKLELFTYTAGSGHFFSSETEKFELEKSAQDLDSLFRKYLEILDLYIRWHILPAEYEHKDFNLAKERFYNLKISYKEEKTFISIIFHPAQDYSFRKDLDYACRRLNERQIIFPVGKKLWFSIT
ncbi:MAG: hypothetical protein KJ880_04575 [Candidatus Omnitrophica bacterium]|nr:hypothetical protein [Candidatus Omnitrophota bacterium]MBU1869553.1 hypothetical protein [Candidatus Omnitrophota bacterium]